MKSILTICLLATTLMALGQSKKKQDQASIKEMCGCYEINFEYAETFSPDKDYEFHKNYRSGALEWAQLVEDESNKISIQHLLIVGRGRIVKHWRQDWLYQNTDIHTYHKDKTWNYESLNKSDVKGQWTQKVFQVDDGLRYQGSGSWVHVDGKHYWENTSDAPLPRREYKKRKDYNVMVRTNRHKITDYGWLHEQDNDKVLRSDNGDKVIAKEKGLNTYKKVDDAKCKAAQEWWAKNQVFWADVRAVWDDVFAGKNTLTFAGKIERKALFDHLFAMGDEMVEVTDYDSEMIREKVRNIINTYQN